MDNEAQTTQIQDDNANIGAAEAHPKPMINVDQQIAHMKAKGITFDLCSEEDAAKQAAFISLITLTKRVLDTCMDLLGMESPEHM